MTALAEKFEYVLEANLIAEIEQVGITRFYKADAIIMDLNDNITHMPLLINGSIKVMRENKEGEEILLYFLEVGDTCTMTLNCCMSKARSQIRAVADSDCQLMMIPSHKMMDWIVNYDSWRAFVFQSYHDRLNEMIEAIDDLAFSDMEGRLLRYLKNRAFVSKGPQIHITHAEIAYDLHSSRVVISRLLKKLENEGRITMSRNQITFPGFMDVL
jgi:CRP/FNR family transcriptional regulator